jgi:hypothetical protein
MHDMPKAFQTRVIRVWNGYAYINNIGKVFETSIDDVISLDKFNRRT